MENIIDQILRLRESFLREGINPPEEFIMSRESIDWMKRQSIDSGIARYGIEPKSGEYHIEVAGIKIH